MHTFTLHDDYTLQEDAWLRDNPIFASGQVIGYRVGGLPDGTTARIANVGAPNGNHWRIMRIAADDTQSKWTGDYDNIQDALASLRQN